MNIASLEFSPISDLSLSHPSTPTLPQILNISSPDKLLLPFNGTQPLASVRTVHASTLFSGGAILNDQLNPDLIKDLEQARHNGVSALYVIGMWESTPFSALWTRHWAPQWSGYQQLKPDWIGSSTFSTDSYTPNHLVGSWENLDRVIAAASNIGISIVPCFVTNTIGLGGALMRENLRTDPETIMMRSADQREFEYLRSHIERSTPHKAYSIYQEHGTSKGSHTLELFNPHHGLDLYRYQYQGLNGESHQCYLQMNGKLYKHTWVIDKKSTNSKEELHCVQLGSEDPFDRGDGNATVWSDTVHRSVHKSSTRQKQFTELSPVIERFSHLRCDMAHLAGVDAWADYARLAREQGKPLDRLLLESYFEHDKLLGQDPSIAVYANFLYNWLHREKMNIPAVMWHIHEHREIYQTHRLTAYVENHDDKGSTYLPEKGAQALIIIASPVESVLWGQNQRTGDEFRIGAQLHISRDDFNDRQVALLNNHKDSHGEYYKFFSKIELLSALPVFRSKDSAWSKAHFAGPAPLEQENLFHIVRTFSDQESGTTDRALVLVDARKKSPGQPVVIDVALSFEIPEQKLSSYKIVNLISGDVQRAGALLSVQPNPGSPEPHSYAFALVHQDRVTEALQLLHQSHSNVPSWQ